MANTQVILMDAVNHSAFHSVQSYAPSGTRANPIVIDDPGLLAAYPLVVYDVVVVPEMPPLEAMPLGRGLRVRRTPVYPLGARVSGYH